jgi:DNA-binding HxlR family transcriptional regulator
MAVFTRLKKLREFARTNLPELRSIEDYDIIQEIGACQETGGRMTHKQLTLAGIGAPATLQRRLSRLVDLGVVHKRLSREDGRIVELSVAPATQAAFSKMSRILRNVLKSPAKRKTAPAPRGARVRHPGRPH